VKIGLECYAVCPEGQPMDNMLRFDQSTIANMTAALEYVCRKLPPDRDNPAIRKYLAEQIVSSADTGQRSLADLTTGLKVVNDLLFPRRRAWLRWFEGGAASSPNLR
jgi:hypothetical protein